MLPSVILCPPGSLGFTEGLCILAVKEKHHLVKCGLFILCHKGLNDIYKKKPTALSSVNTMFSPQDSITSEVIHRHYVHLSLPFFLPFPSHAPSSLSEPMSLLPSDSLLHVSSTILVLALKEQKFKIDGWGRSNHCNMYPIWHDFSPLYGSGPQNCFSAN